MSHHTAECHPYYSLQEKPYKKDTAGNAHWVVHYGILAQGLPLNSTMDSPQGIPLYINPQVYWVVPWVYKHRSHKPKVRRFGTFTDWTFQKVALHVQVQKVWDVKRSETSNIQVKCSSRKLWLTHEDEKPIRLSPIMSWDLWQGNLIIRLTVFWESSNIFSNPVLKCTKRWLPNLQGVLDVLKHWNFTVCKWCITRYPLPMPNSTSLLR